MRSTRRSNRRSSRNRRLTRKQSGGDYYTGTIKNIVSRQQKNRLNELERLRELRMTSQQKKWNNSNHT
jgi:hypothetical protein